MTQQELIDLCLTFPGSAADYPFAEGHCVVRHAGNRKWFALVFYLNERLCVNLKCDPLQADFWRNVYHDCVPAWHMNKEHWNTVILNGDVPLQELETMIADSFSLTKPKSKGKTTQKTSLKTTSKCSLKTAPKSAHTSLRKKAP